MIAALLLTVGICAQPPLFNQGDFVPSCLEAPPGVECFTTCAPELQTVECDCAEWLHWDPVPEAEWYKLQRCLAGGSCFEVGDTRHRNHEAFVDEDGEFHEEIIETFWYFAWDSPFPIEGATYTYRVKACRLDPVQGELCSIDWSNPVQYTAAPYYCYEDGLLVTCE